MSDGYAGIGLLGAPGSGAERLGVVLEAAGFFPADRTQGLNFQVSDLSDFDCGAVEIVDWAQSILVEAVSYPEATARATSASQGDQIKMAFSDALECAQGSPLLWADPRLTLIARSWIQDASTPILPIVLVRNPLGLARTLAEEWSMPLSEALALWECYSAAALAAVEGQTAMAIRIEAVTLSSGHEFEKMLKSISALLSVDAAVQINTDQAPSAALDDLAQEDEAEFLQRATGHQAQIWKALSSLRPEPAVVRTRADLRAPSEMAQECLMRRQLRLTQERQAAEQMAKLSVLHDELTAVYKKVGDLESHLQQLQDVHVHDQADLARVEGEKRQLRQDLQDLLGRLRAVSQSQSEGQARAAALEHQLLALNHEYSQTRHLVLMLEQELSAVRRSRTWRAGELVLSPLKWMRERRT